MAKDLLVSWLKKEEENSDFCNFCGIAWRKNYGVYSELKFYTTSHPYYFELSEGLIECGMYHPTNSDICFDKDIDRGKIIFVPDITIFHKGQAQIFIEIVHKSGPTRKKKEDIHKFFDGLCYELYTIKPENILCNTGVPEWLAYKQIH